jgi:hypothetical protein
MAQSIIRDHVISSAALLGITLDDDRVGRVTIHLDRIANFAQLLESEPLGPDVEPAAIYCPAPFPLEIESSDDH